MGYCHHSLDEPERFRLEFRRHSRPHPLGERTGGSFPPVPTEHGGVSVRAADVGRDNPGQSAVLFGNESIKEKFDFDFL